MMYFVIKYFCVTVSTGMLQKNIATHKVHKKHFLVHQSVNAFLRILLEEFGEEPFFAAINE